MSPSLRLKPRFALSFVGVFAFLYGGAAFLLVYSALLSFSYLTALAVVLLCYLGWDAWRVWHIHILHQHAWLQGDLVIRDDVVVLGDEQFATILPDSFSHPALVVLRLRLPTRHHVSCVLFFDALPAEDFRRLRVHLRHGMKSEQPYAVWLSKLKSWWP